jgi:hypothetical protein
VVAELSLGSLSGPYSTGHGHRVEPAPVMASYIRFKELGVAVKLGQNEDQFGFKRRAANATGNPTAPKDTRKHVRPQALEPASERLYMGWYFPKKRKSRFVFEHPPNLKATLHQKPQARRRTAMHPIITTIFIIVMSYVAALTPRHVIRDALFSLGQRIIRLAARHPSWAATHVHTVVAQVDNLAYALQGVVDGLHSDDVVTDPLQSPVSVPIVPVEPPSPGPRWRRCILPCIELLVFRKIPGAQF